jgi:hypothetical protein
MFGRRSFLTLMAIGILAGAPALAAQAPGHPHHPRAEWRHPGDHWAGRRVWLERRGMRYRQHRVWLERREVHRFRRWERRRHFARHHWRRHWDGII